MREAQMAHDTVTPKTLARRVEMLERQNRRMKQISVATLVIFSSLAAAQTLMPKPVAASRFTLLDDDNRTRAQLETSTLGSGRAGVNPTLSFSDQEGRVRLRLGL